MKQPINQLKKTLVSSFLSLKPLILHSVKLIILISLTLSPLCKAQDNALNDELIKKTQEDFLVVLGAGIGGAVLGLSTLSFVEKPARHVYKIWMGASLGVIVGVLYVVYNRAQAGTADLRASADFNSSERALWHQNSSLLEISHESSFKAEKLSAFHVNVFHYRF